MSLFDFLDKTSPFRFKYTYIKRESGLQSTDKLFIECDPASFLCTRENVVRSEWQWETAAAAAGNAVLHLSLEWRKAVKSVRHCAFVTEAFKVHSDSYPAKVNSVEFSKGDR